MMLSALLAVILEESLSCTVKLLRPGVVGVPVMAPAAESAMPPGNAPDETDHWYPPVPPVATRFCEYAVPTIPSGSDGVAIVNAADAIFMLSALIAVPLEASLTSTVKLTRPGDTGVPEIVPAAESAKPPGSDPAVRLHA